MVAVTPSDDQRENAKLFIAIAPLQIGAQLAAMLGLSYAFASQFAPDALMRALEVYRAKFQPSAHSA